MDEDECREADDDMIDFLDDRFDPDAMDEEPYWPEADSDLDDELDSRLQ